MEPTSRERLRGRASRACLLGSLAAAAACAPPAREPTVEAPAPSVTPTVGPLRPPSPPPREVTPAPSGSLLTPERAVRLRRISDLRWSPDASRLACVVSEPTDAGTESHVWVADVRRGSLRPFTVSAKSERAPAWSPDGRWLAFLSTRSGDNQVYRMPVDGGEASPVTRARHGVSAFRWSPDGQSIAFLAGEEPKVEEADDPRVIDRARNLDRVWIVGVESKEARQATAGPFLIDEIAWPTADKILAVATDQPRKESPDRTLYAVDPVSGSFTAALHPPPPFSDIVASPGGGRLTYLGTATGGPMPHDLFVTDGAAPAVDVTRTLDRAIQEVRWQDERTIFFRAVSGFRCALYRIDVGASAVSPVDLPRTVRAFDVARDGTLAYVDVAFDRLPEIYVKPPGGPPVAVGHVQDPEWAGIALANAELFTTRSFDGTPIEAALFRPSKAQTTKPPLVLLVHGGPNSSFTSDYFWFNSWPQLLVAHGYQVLLVNPRGSTGYGEAFVKSIRGDWGGGDYKDLMAVLDHVVACGEVDPARLGIGGWSYGAEMTQWAIGHTRRFRAAVSGAGVFDQSAEFGTEDDPSGDEWHFGTPWDRPEVFARTSPQTFIKNARTPTLIVHGDADKNNPLGQSQALYRALQHLGVESELVVYPGEGHGPRKRKHQIDVLERMLAWYDAHLR